MLLKTMVPAVQICPVEMKKSVLLVCVKLRIQNERGVVEDRLVVCTRYH